MRKFYLIAVLLAALVCVAGCKKSNNSPYNSNVTADFDPEFADLLQELGIIPDAEKIMLEDLENITTLNVSGTVENPGELTSLEGLQHFKSLQVLYCVRNQLAELDLTQNLALAYLDCSNNQLKKLDMTQNPELRNLACNFNQLTELDVTMNPELTTLYCGDNQLTSLDVSKNTKLTYLTCHFNQLTGLDMSKNRALEYFYCNNNPGNGGTFVVKAWFDNNNIPTPTGGSFTTGTWAYGGNTIAIDYQRVD